MNDIIPLLSPVITLILAAVTFYGMINTRYAKLETKVDCLCEEVRKYNNMVERIGRLETENDQIWHTIAEMKAELKELRKDV